MSQLKPGDRALIVIGIIALLACGAWLFATRLAAPSEGLVVVCQNKEGFYRADPLDAATEYVVRTEDAAEAGYNTVRIADGAVEVVEADCSNQVCVEHDPIRAAGEQIVCLPHGLVVEVVGDEDDATPLVLD